MHIRPAVERDIPAIVQLLRLSLGEDVTLKSESYWRWKHIDNPFGRSPVLLGFEDSELVGVRAFMRWKWTGGNRIYESVRAVDTATHPTFRGKGTFRKLTLALLEECKTHGWDFVFNTPNKVSKAGYIKMGWAEAGRLPVNLKIRQPFSMALNLARLKKQDARPMIENDIRKYLSKPGIDQLLFENQHLYPGDLITAHSRESLLWRYDKVAVKQYYASGLETDNKLSTLLFYRVKPGIAGIELRITDIFLSDDKSKDAVNALIRKRVKIHNADFVTMCGTNPFIELGSFFGFNRIPVGPMVTVRDISRPFTSLLRGFHQWRPSVGDLELF